MSAQNSSSTGVQDPSSVGGAAGAETKGKGLATEQPEDTSMAVDDEDDDDDDDEDADEEVQDAEEDGMEEIDPGNVIGRRTRGKVIDFAKAAAQNPADDDEDEEDDEDFEIPDEKMGDA